jgi:hypothetical protein
MMSVTKSAWAIGLLLAGTLGAKEFKVESRVTGFQVQDHPGIRLLHQARPPQHLT